MRAAVECSGLTKAFGSTVAIDNLSFKLPANKITGLIGRNGAGKTTLLKLIAGYLAPTGGSVKVFSENPFNNVRVSANLIFVDDKMTMPQSLNLGEILEAVGGFYENWDHRLARGLLEYFNLNPRQHHYNLSKGMKSTFNMIVGIAARCPLTIFDEPTVGMDAAVRKDFYRALLKDFLQHPRTVFFSSHLLNEISEILDDILLLDQGRCRLYMTKDAVKEFAVGLQGKEEAVAAIAGGSEIFYRKKLGPENLYLVVPNRFSEEELLAARRKGVEVSAVPAEDLCVYLTAKHKGGIDDVFDRN
ncbi:MAG TPA: ABC transporter ATP-binding protein [Bacillota bacterium]|nr:ABC transporter ATP-binding protein [Bacillota bacterium]HPT34123.1 ABC transporter ATP-binding protein [Bacillota bacterium]